MIKRSAFILIMLVTLLFACSNQNLISDKEAKEIVDTYDITAFSVVIDTNEQSEVLSASFTEKKDRSEAEYSHKKDEVNLHGKKALDKINEALEKMKPTPETEETELIKQVAETFEFSDYKMIKIEITFKGHDSKEIMFSK